MRAEAKVINLDGAMALVETKRTSACEGCHKNTNGEECSVCSLMGGKQTFTATARNRVGAKVGDHVVIESATGRMMWYAVLVFLLPVVLAIAFWGIAALFTDSMLLQFACAVVGFAGCFVGLWIYSKQIQKKRCDIEITEILHPSGLTDEKE